MKRSDMAAFALCRSIKRETRAHPAQLIASATTTTVGWREGGMEGGILGTNHDQSPPPFPFVV